MAKTPSVFDEPVVDISDKFTPTTNIYQILNKKVIQIGHIIIGTISFLPIALSSVQNVRFFDISEGYRPAYSININSVVVKVRTDVTAPSESISLALGVNGIIYAPNRGGYANIGAVTT